MTKKKRIMISLEADELELIDGTCKKYNETREPGEPYMTRSNFIEICIAAFVMMHEKNAKANEPKQGE